MSHKKRVADAIDAVCERHAESLAGLVDEPSPSPQPEMPEVCVRVEPLVYVPLERLRALLATQGLHVIESQNHSSTYAVLHALRAKVARSVAELEKAQNVSGNRWREWGSRAESVAEHLEQALEALR
jgi:hypothetical protein